MLQNLFLKKKKRKKNPSQHGSSHPCQVKVADKHICRKGDLTIPNPSLSGLGITINFQVSFQLSSA